MRLLLLVAMESEGKSGVEGRSSGDVTWGLELVGFAGRPSVEGEKCLLGGPTAAGPPAARYPVQLNLEPFMLQCLLRGHLLGEQLVDEGLSKGRHMDALTADDVGQHQPNQTHVRELGVNAPAPCLAWHIIIPACHIIIPASQRVIRRQFCVCLSCQLQVNDHPRARGLQLHNVLPAEVTVNNACFVKHLRSLTTAPSTYPQLRFVVGKHDAAQRLCGD
mmetsp:Transcript_2809/g.6163  ORF Transcript_2809/g.6163 Transcript_2809/m.6163 type:complete len:219 (+) Transcript_2809:514-1170(+)